MYTARLVMSCFQLSAIAYFSFRVLYEIRWQGYLIISATFWPKKVVLIQSAGMDEYGSSSTWRSQSEKIHQESTIVGDEACVNRRFCLRRWGRERPLHTISNAGLVTGKAYFTVRTMILARFSRHLVPLSFRIRYIIKMIIIITIII